MKFLLFLGLTFSLAACWPSKISFVDGAIPEDWKTFSVKTLISESPNTPLSYPPTLSEEVKDGILNRTRLQLVTYKESPDVEIEGVITQYTLAPISLQGDDNGAQNRLAVTVKFDIFIHATEEDEMHVTSTRFVDYDVNADFNSIEQTLLENINEQIIQDLMNKLLSNW